MPDDLRGSSERGQSIDRLLAAYLHAEAGGETPQRQQLLAEHPEYAAELAAFFAKYDEARLSAASEERIVAILGARGRALLAGARLGVYGIYVVALGWLLAIFVIAVGGVAWLVVYLGAALTGHAIPAVDMPDFGGLSETYVFLPCVLVSGAAAWLASLAARFLCCAVPEPKAARFLALTALLGRLATLMGVLYLYCLCWLGAGSFKTLIGMLPRSGFVLGCALLAWVGLLAEWWFARTLRRFFATDQRFALDETNLAQIRLPTAQVQAITAEVTSGATASARKTPARRKWWNREVPSGVLFVLVAVVFATMGNGVGRFVDRLFGAMMLFTPILQLLHAVHLDVGGKSMRTLADAPDSNGA